MEDPRWLRLITIGLVLAAVAVGYFLFTGRFSAKNVTAPKSQISQVRSANSPSPKTSVNAGAVQQNASPNPSSAFNMIAQRSNNIGGQNVQTLPRTGFPIGLLGALSVSGMLIGWGLKRFPH